MAADGFTARVWRRRGGLVRHTRAVRVLQAAGVAGDTERLRAVLHPAVVLLSDGGEPDATGSVGIVEHVAERMICLLNAQHGITVAARSVNGRTGLLLIDGDTVTGVISIAVRGRRIDKIWIVRRPDGLRGFNPKTL